MGMMGLLPVTPAVTVPVADLNRAVETAGMAAMGVAKILDPGADAATEIRIGGTVAVIEARKVPEVITAVTATVEEAMEASTALRQVLRPGATAAVEASETAVGAAAAPMAMARKAVAAGTAVATRSGVPQADVVLQQGEPTPVDRRTTVGIPNRSQMVGEVAAAVAAAARVATEVVAVPTEPVPRHPALTVITVEHPREGTRAARATQVGQVHLILEVEPDVAPSSGLRRTLVLGSTPRRGSRVQSEKRGVTLGRLVDVVAVPGPAAEPPSSSEARPSRP